MKKPIINSLALAIIVIGGLMVYVFIISPPIKAEFISSWLQIEASRKPEYAGNEICAQCHEDIYAQLMSQKHSSVPCEDCHGPLYDHTLDPEKRRPIIDDSRESCVLCHKKIPPRKAVGTIDPETHAPEFKCITCHEPHKPWFK